VQLERVPELDERVRALRALGYRLAVDDLGAGYAGLSSFVRLSPEFVKIDPSLTRDIDRSTEQQTLMRSTLDLCRCMSVGTVVEGVETGAELRTLSLLGAELLQGYRFGAPGSAFPAVASVAFEV
jgi:EAL domain-containing protein (putative c-di-GMP-specific phosphodiesterase class I)